MWMLERPTCSPTETVGSQEQRRSYVYEERAGRTEIVCYIQTYQHYLPANTLVKIFQLLMLFPPLLLTCDDFRSDGVPLFKLTPHPNATIGVLSGGKFEQ